MEGFKVVGIKKNGYEKDGKQINTIELYLNGESEDVEGFTTSSCYVNDAKSPKLYAKACTIGLGDLIVPVEGKFAIEQIVVLSKAK